MNTLLGPLLLAVLLLVCCETWADGDRSFLDCLSTHIGDSTVFSDIVHSRPSSNYSDILHHNIYNLRFKHPSTPKPLVIITPTQPSHVQATVVCARANQLQIRTRCGGHDFEGLSYVAHVPFVVIDMNRLRSVEVDVENRAAWVHGGAILGEVYYGIAQKTYGLGFPAGFCSTVGVSGHVSGGGYGVMMRKYGMAADHVVDALLVDAQGRLLDRESMGEDLFWAIRGGGGAGFGVIVAWKLELVPVPPKVSLCGVNKTLEQNLVSHFHKWQRMAHTVPHELFPGVFLTRGNSTHSKAVNGNFFFYYLGSLDSLIPLLGETFPELEIAATDCFEASYAEAAVAMAAFPIGSPLEVLLDRTHQIYKRQMKVMSDYVTEPISDEGAKAVFERFCEDVPDQFVEMGIVAYGGRMSEIAEDAIPYPHRAGILYGIHYYVGWDEEGLEAADRHLRWSKEFYEFVAPYMTKNPRLAYINYRDLDIGGYSRIGETSYEEARVWGYKYFVGNFDRLVRIKSSVDPDNFFRDEQSIPVRPSLEGRNYARTEL